MRHRLPFAAPGQVIGLLGGSFDPPHEGHRRISLEALKRFQLDQLWWLVSPGNPLKAHGPAPMADRMAAARRLMCHPRVQITGVEADLGTRYTQASLRALARLRPDLRFVWLMGADNLTQFHHWQGWREIMRRVPVGVLARPGDRLAARNSVAARTFDAARLPASHAALLGRRAPPAWCYLNLPLSPASSTALRAKHAHP